MPHERAAASLHESSPAASSFFARPSTSVVTAFIDDHRARFGVEPICGVLTGHGVKPAPNTHYAAKSGPPATRS